MVCYKQMVALIAQSVARLYQQLATYLCRAGLSRTDNKTKKIKINKPAGMYERLAVTFRVAVVSHNNSRQKCEELPWFSSISGQPIHVLHGVMEDK